jgi:hypothetical protein
MFRWNTEESRTEERKINWKSAYSLLLTNPCLDAHSQTCVPTTTDRKMIPLSAYSRSVRDLCICQLVTWKWVIQNETSYFIPTPHASRQAAPLSVFPGSRCNWRGVAVTLLTRTRAHTHTRVYKQRGEVERGEINVKTVDYAMAARYETCIIFCQYRSNI